MTSAGTELEKQLILLSKSLSSVMQETTLKTVEGQTKTWRAWMALIKKCTETSLISLVVIKNDLGSGGIIDQGVIHFDTWLRRHSQPVRIHSSFNKFV